MNLDILKNITYGMYLVTSNYDNTYCGCIVNTVTQITNQNIIFSVSINKNNFTNEIIKKSKKLLISIISEKTSKDTIVNFGYKSGKNKFDNITYNLINDLPFVLDYMCGYITGDVINVIDCETHDIFLFRVNDTEKINEYNPMTYSYYQNNLKGTSPKNAPTYQEEKIGTSSKYECIICGHIYDDEKEEIPFLDLPSDWVCPVCGVGKDKFRKIS